MPRIVVVVTLTASLLFAVACGGNDSGNSSGSGSSDSSTSSSGNAWKGKFETGTEVTLELWIPAADPGVANFEAFRKATGAPAVQYGKVTAKNTTSRPDTGRFVSLTDASGDVFGPSRTEVQFVCAQLSRWLAVVLTQSTQLNSDYSKLVQNDCAGATAAGIAIAPGQTVTYYVAYPGETPPSFQRVFMGAGNELKR